MTPPFPKLCTERLNLRELTAGDAPALFEIHRDAEAMRFFGTDPMLELAQAHAVIEKFASWRDAANPGVRWGLEDTASGALLGTCGLFGWNREWRKCTVGYELAATAHGQGFMNEALTAALGWGFEHMLLHRVEAQIHADNAASIKLAQRLGFRPEGVLREVAFWGGGFHDLVQYSLLSYQWLDLMAGRTVRSPRHKALT